MRSWVSRALIVCIVGSTVPLAAEEDDGQLADWSRVRALAPGTAIVVSVRNSEPAERVIIRADESNLITLNLTTSPLPSEATRTLSTLAATHPEYFVDMFQSGQFVDRVVRLGRDGVFMSGQKLADLRDVVEIEARSDVAQIMTRRKGRGFWGHLGVLGGYFVGAMAGGFIAGFACQATAGRGRCDTGAFLTGGLIGGIAGGVHGFRASIRETEEVVYDPER